MGPQAQQDKILIKWKELTIFNMTRGMTKVDKTNSISFLDLTPIFGS